MYEKLTDKEWLQSKYLDEQLSLTEIAKEIGCKYPQVRYAAMKHGIPIRSKGEGQKLRYGLNDYFVFNKPVIEGCLLGDGFMKCQNRDSDDSLPAFAKNNIFYDHVVYVAEQVFSQNAVDRIKERVNSGGYSGPDAKPIFSLSTLTHKELLPLYREWYPSSNQFKKVIPKSISFTKDTLLHWFLDDGYTYHARHKRGTNIYTRLYFCTQSFEFTDLEWISERVKSLFGLQLYPRFHSRHGKHKGSGYELEMSAKSIPDFFAILGACPVPSLAYKWK